MDVVAIIGELRKELERIDSMILALDSLQLGRRRGRPPKLLQELRAQSAREKPVSAKPRKKAAKSKSAKPRRSKKAETNGHA